MEEITRMQENLLLRRTVGWTAEEFGGKQVSHVRLLTTQKMVVIN